MLASLASGLGRQGRLERTLVLLLAGVQAPWIATAAQVALRWSVWPPAPRLWHLTGPAFAAVAVTLLVAPVVARRRAAEDGGSA